MKWKEASVVINDYELSNSEVTTIRVALNSFLIELRKIGLGEDFIGRAITEQYLIHVNKIIKLMMENT